MAHKTFRKSLFLKVFLITLSDAHAIDVGESKVGTFFYMYYGHRLSGTGHVFSEGEAETL